jgi:hypothetical protein
MSEKDKRDIGERDVDDDDDSRSTGVLTSGSPNVTPVSLETVSFDIEKAVLECSRREESTRNTFISTQPHAKHSHTTLPPHHKRGGGVNRRKGAGPINQ